MVNNSNECIKLIGYISEMLTYMLINPRESITFIEGIEEPDDTRCHVYSCNRLLNEIKELNSELLNSKNNTEKYEVDYTRLFVSAYPRPLCPPYESYYATRSKLLARPDIISDLRSILRELKLKIDENKESLPDHLPAELELVSYITTLKSDKSQQLLERLLYKHLSIWLNEFPKCIKKNAWTGYYKKLGEIIELYGKCLHELI